MNFWEQKKLEELSNTEWEQICSRCGHCCLIKLQDEKDDEIYYTDLVCRYFNHQDCSCTEYHNRCTLVPECLKLNKQNVDKISWMPKACAYRQLFETGTLPTWHPLNTGKDLDEKYSIKNRCTSELLIKEEDFEDHIIDEDEL